MDQQQLQTIIAAGETLDVEFKRAIDVDALSDKELAAALACLANGNGGVLLMGVEDDGAITGVGPRHTDTTDIGRLRLEIARLTKPALQVAVDEFRVGDAHVLAIHVPLSEVPVSVGGRFTRRAQKRDGTPECTPMGIAELQSVALTATGIDYMDRVVPGVGWDALDPLEIERFRRLARSANGDAGLAELSDREVARALRAIRVRGESVEVTLGGIALFGRSTTIEEHLASSRAQFQVLRGTDVLVNESASGTVLFLAEWLGGGGSKHAMRSTRSMSGSSASLSLV